MFYITGELKFKRPFKLYKGKGKAIALQDWTGPEVFMSLRLSDSKTIDT